MQSTTKQDIQGLRSEIKSQRTEFKRTGKSIRSEVLKVEERVENIEEKIDVLDKKVGGIEKKVGGLEQKVDVLQEGQNEIKTVLTKLQITLDGFVGRVDNLTVENQVGAHQIRELRVEVNKHDKRIKRLETS